MSERDNHQNGSQNEATDPFLEELHIAAGNLVFELTDGSKSLTKKARKAINTSVRSTVTGQYQEYVKTPAIKSTVGVRTIVVDKTQASSADGREAIAQVQEASMNKMLFKIRNNVNAIISATTTAANAESRMD